MGTHDVTIYPYDILFRRYYGNAEEGKPVLSVPSVANRILDLISKAGEEANARRTDKQKAEGSDPDVSGSWVDYHELSIRSQAQFRAMAMTMRPNDMNDIIALFAKANDDFGRHWRKVAPEATKQFEDYQKAVLEEIAEGAYEGQASEEELKQLKKSIKEQRKKYTKWYNKPQVYIGTAVVLGLVMAVPQIKKIFGA